MNITLYGKKKSAFAFYFSFTVWLIFFSGYLHAQQKFNILHFNNDNYLPQNSVDRVAFDRYGYTWLSTQYGLVRYDGSHFRTYNTYNTPALKNNRFTYVANDAKGNIYALDGTNSVIEATPAGFIERTDLVFRQNCFFVEQFVDLKELIKANNKISVAYDFLQTVFNIDSVRFYFTSRKSAGYFDGKTFVVHPLDTTISGFRSQGLLFVLLKDGSFNVYKNSRQITGGLKMEGDIVLNKAYGKWGITSSEISADPDSNAYVLLDHALYLLKGSESHITSQLLCDSLEVKACHYIRHNAATGAYYLCSQVDGLYILEPVPNPKIFRSLVIPPFPGNSNINVHYAVIEAGKNKIFSGNNNVYDNEIAIPALTKITTGYSLYSDKNQHLFFQSGPSLYETDTSFHVFAKYPLPDPGVLKCTAKDSKGVLWVAVDNKLGILQSGRFHFALHELPLKEIESFIFQGDSLLWLATSGGLFLFHINDHRLEKIKELGNSNIRTLKPDNDGTLWIGTYGQGFYRYKNKQLVKFPVDKNAYLSMAHCFMEDRNGYFWIPTNHGLFQVKKADLDEYADGKSKAVYYQYYDKTSGFATNEFNGGCNPCGIRISDGSFILPSIDGLVKFNPETIHALLPTGAIFIDKISADTIIYSPVSSFSLGPKFHQLVFEVSSAYYGNVNNNNIEYHIQGLEEGWYPLNENGKITITSLPHGNYALQLRRLSGFGLNNYAYKNISFNVVPEFFETTWFRLLALLFLIALIYLGFRVRYNVLKKQKLALEKQVAERTTALQQTVQELQQSENSLYNTIQQKEKITSILVHDLKSPLRFLTVVSDHIHGEIDNGSREDLKKLTQEMKKSSRRISMFTDEFLAWLLAAKEDFTAGNEVIKLKILGDETADFFEDMIASNQNILDVNIPDDLTVIADERLLRVILRNLIDNANKHTRNGLIKLEACSLNNHVEIKVQDNGKGMTEEQLRSFSDVDGNSLGFSLNVSNQLGSRIIRNFIRKLGGTLIAESEVGKGTTIRLQFK